MSQSLHLNLKIKKNSNIKFYLLTSFFTHVIICLAIFLLPKSIKELFFSKPPLVIREYVQVDIVGMPKLTKKELQKFSKKINHEASIVKKLKTAEEIQPPINEKLENGLKKDSKEITSFLSSMAKRKVVKKVKASDKRDSARKVGRLGSKIGRLERLALEGNTISRGAVAVGDNVGFSDDDYQIYLSSIPSQVRPFWKLPSYLSGKGLKARVKIRINSNGRIISMDVIESSGVDEFDQRALNSVESVKIFTAPSKSIREFLAIKGIVLGFPL